MQSEFRVDAQADPELVQVIDGVRVEGGNEADDGSKPNAEVPQKQVEAAS